jgi:uncharacterized membrane protein
MRPFTSIDALEDVDALDAPAERLAAIADVVTAWPPLRDALEGKPFGHSAHPMLVQLPIGAWVSAGWLDFVAGTDKAATVLTGVGVASALPAVASGLADYRSLDPARRRIGVVHAISNQVSLGLQILSLRARMRGDLRTGQWLGLAGTAVLAVGGLLGGHLAHALDES